MAPTRSHVPPTRRAVAAGLAAALGSPARPGSARPSPGQPASPARGEAWLTLTAAPARAGLLPEPAPETEVWAFDDHLPGPVIRLKHGDEARVRLVNQTERPLSLHWHGVRNANPMDGVGGLTQAPV